MALMAKMAAAQSPSWYAILGANSITDLGWNPDLNRELYAVNFTVKNTMSNATELYAIEGCGPFTAYDPEWGDYCPQTFYGPQDGMTHRIIAPGATATVAVRIYVTPGTNTTAQVWLQASATYDEVWPNTPVRTGRATVVVTNGVPTLAPTFGPGMSSSRPKRRSSMDRIRTGRQPM